MSLVDKKVISTVLFIIVFFGLISDAHSRRYRAYRNTKYSYSLEYPSTWFLGYLGGSEGEAIVLRICTDGADVTFSDGDLPQPLVEVMVSDLGELKKAGAKLPDVGGPKDWLNWERSNWDEPEKERIGPFLDEGINVNGSEGIKTTFIKPAFPGAGPIVEVILYNPSLNLIYSIKYLGAYPRYEEHLKDFKRMLGSFAQSVK